MKKTKRAVRCTRPELRHPYQVGKRVLAVCLNCDRLHVVEQKDERRGGR